MAKYMLTSLFNPSSMFKSSLYNMKSGLYQKWKLSQFLTSQSWSFFSQVTFFYITIWSIASLFGHLNNSPEEEQHIWKPRVKYPCFPVLSWRKSLLTRTLNFQSAAQWLLWKTVTVLRRNLIFFSSTSIDHFKRNIF